MNLRWQTICSNILMFDTVTLLHCFQYKCKLDVNFRRVLTVFSDELSKIMVEKVEYFDGAAVYSCIFQ